MKTSEVNESLIGKRVECVVTALRTTGVIVGIVSEEDSSKYVFVKGVRIKLDRPVNWGDDYIEEYESTARTKDEFGNLCHTNVIC